MAFLSIFTSVINFLALAISIWLGWYILTHSPNRPISWLTSLTLWSLSGIFLNMLFALNPPPAPALPSVWLRFFFPFWSAQAFETGWVSWLAGWQVTPAIALWHHATLLMCPERLTPRRKAQVFLVYGVALFAIYLQISSPQVYTSGKEDPLFLNTLYPGALHPIFIWFLMLFVIMSIINLLAAARAMQTNFSRKQFVTLAAATFIAGLTGPITVIASSSAFPIPRVVISLLLGLSVAILGYGVARYSALIEGRIIRRDFIYNAVAIGLVTLLYLGVTRISVTIFNIPPAVFVFVVLLAITTHSLVDYARKYLDLIFYRKESRQLRDNLRKLPGLVGEQNLADVLSFVFESFCDSIQALYGFILLFEKDSSYTGASYRWHEDLSNLHREDFLADDVLQLEPGQFSPPLKDASLLIPLYNDAEQIGAMVLGRPVNGLQYLELSIELALDVSDRAADVISASRREVEHLTKAAQIAKSRQFQAIDSPGKIPVNLVGDALRNIYDYAHLGDSLFAELKAVKERLPDEPVTHLDRGKVVCEVIKEAIDKLRPEDHCQEEPPPREWHPFLILHGAYCENKLNRLIMSQLYISEGTFNRTRRSAIRSVARVLEEMEAAQA